MTPSDSLRLLETVGVSQPVHGHRRPDPLHIDWETQHFPETSILWSNPEAESFDDVLPPKIPEL